jgi:hypothetical protein
LTTLVLLAAPAASAEPVNPYLPWHDVRVDHTGRLLAWSEPQKGRGYDRVLRDGWRFLEQKVPRDKVGGTGLKVYLVAAVFDPETLQGRYWQHNPIGVYATMVDSLLGWYPYSGDTRAITVVREMLGYQLAHGTTPATWDWPGVPFFSSCALARDYGGCYPGVAGFFGGVQTDKVGEMGTAYALFYELTGERRYLRAAVRCADALARHVRAGDAADTPWPFRVDGRTGTTMPGEEYGGLVVAPLRLFDELVRLGAGDVAAYRRARALAWRWMLDHPLNPQSPAWNDWSGYFEDVPANRANRNQVLATMTAYYLLTRSNPRALDPAWREHVQGLLDWVLQQFGRGPYHGAWAIDEQSICCSPAGLGSHTSRWAAVNALYAERTGDTTARAKAFRSLNYATYFADSGGRVACCGGPHPMTYWFSDGYGDYLRHFSWAMGAIPAFAPAREDHLLRSTSVVRHVRYRPRRISYRTFAPSGTEVLRLSFRPARITAGGRPLHRRTRLNGAGYTARWIGRGDVVVRIARRGARIVTISA